MRRGVRVRSLVAGLGALALLVECVSADIIRVPDDQPTIQAGIDAAVNGDEVVVADGTWFEGNLDYAGRRITVRSEHGPAGCIIDSAGFPHGFLFDDAETADAIVDGFTITHGAGSLIGINAIFQLFISGLCDLQLRFSDGQLLLHLYTGDIAGCTGKIVEGLDGAIVDPLQQRQA